MQNKITNKSNVINSALNQIIDNAKLAVPPTFKTSEEIQAEKKADLEKRFGKGISLCPIRYAR